ncbi:MAG: Dps family protein [Hyphomonadaceae bacterium]
MDIGIEEKARKQIAGALEQVLADTYALYAKTHGYHWNVEGPRFNSLHTMFEAQYRDLWGALDLIAERIRSLGYYAPMGESIGSKSQLSADNSVPDADQMVANLVKGHEAVVRSARAALKQAEEAGDQATADLMTQRVAEGEKTAWMLRATNA